MTESIKSDGVPTTQGTVFLIAVVVAIAVALMTFIAVYIERLYLENHSFFFDPASYYYRNCLLLEALYKNGTWQTLLNDLSNNDRCPARTIPYLLINPSGLADLWGHLWTEIPMIFSFVFLLAYTIYKRTSSLLLAFASVAMFCSFPFLYDPINGIAGYWLDHAAACLLGSSVLCLLNYCIAPRKSWLFAWGLFASLSALSRWSAASYFFCFAVVALPVAIWATRDKLKKSWMSYLISSLSYLPGLVFTLYFLQRNISYYKTFGYAFNASVLLSTKWVFAILGEMLSVPLLSFLLVVSAQNLVRLFMRTTDRAYCFIAVWFPIATYMFVCLIAKAWTAHHPNVYFAPALLVAAFCPLKRTERHWGWWQSLFVAMAVVGVSLAFFAVSEFRERAVHAAPHQRIRKQCDVALCDLIAQTKASTFGPFDTESVGPQLEAFFKYKIICKGTGGLFSVHEAYLTGFHGRNMTPEQMADLVFKRVKSHVNLVAVFANPEDALKPGVFNNRYSSTISRLVSERVPKDPDMKLISTLDGPSGKLSVYQNLNLQSADQPSSSTK